MEEEVPVGGARVADIAMAAGAVEDHPVGALREVDDESVIARASRNRAAGPGESDLVITGAAVDPVVTARARQDVVFSPTIDKIVASAAIDRIDTGKAPNVVGFLRTFQNIV